MNTSTTPLAILVSSLSAQEKRYIRLYLDRQERGGKELMQLYDDCIAAISESNVKRRAVKSDNPTQRSYLYRVVLKALRSYNEERTVDINIYERITNSSLLFEKRLYDLSLRELDSAYELALTNERFA